jgi:hypothetical protein
MRLLDVAHDPDIVFARPSGCLHHQRPSTRVYGWRVLLVVRWSVPRPLSSAVRFDDRRAWSSILDLVPLDESRRSRRSPASGSNTGSVGRSTRSTISEGT